MIIDKTGDHSGYGTLGVVEIDGTLYEVKRRHTEVDNGRDDNLIFDPLASTDEVEKR